jgi:hypothetical protein
MIVIIIIIIDPGTPNSYDIAQSKKILTYSEALLCNMMLGSGDTLSSYFTIRITDL